jgi:hypothetical protein
VSLNTVESTAVAHWRRQALLWRLAELGVTVSTLGVLLVLLALTSWWGR